MGLSLVYCVLYSGRSTVHAETPSIRICDKRFFSLRTLLRVAILICDIEQAMLATLMDSSEALAPKKKLGSLKPDINSRQQRYTR